MKTIAIATALTDQGLARVEVSEDGKDVARLLMNEVQLSECIDRLAAIREQMTNPIAATLDPSEIMVPTMQPQWRVVPAETDQGVRGTLLALRHPGKGWNGFLFDGEQAKELGQTLLDWSEGTA